MDRRTLLVWMALGCVRPALVAAAWPAGKVARVGYLDSGAATGTTLFESFRQGLRALGWIEGHNLALEVRAAHGKYEALPALAAELVSLKSDVIFASSTPAALATKQASGGIPVVIGRVADPVASGLVKSLSRPGGNVTGWTHQGLDLRQKYVEILKHAIPSATLIGVLWNRGNPIHARSLTEIEAASKALRVKVHTVGVTGADDLDRAFGSLTAARVQALAVFPDGMFIEQALHIIELAAKARLPTLYGASEIARAGGLLGYGVNLPEMYRRGATYVDKILNGANPGDLPVEQPTRFELVINLRTARALGLTIPKSLLARADDVVE